MYPAQVRLKNGWLPGLVTEDRHIAVGGAHGGILFVKRPLDASGFVCVVGYDGFSGRNHCAARVAHAGLSADEEGLELPPAYKAGRH